jgi:hypothetical protein
MFYINDKTGEKITKLFEENKINSDEYFNIMKYLSIDTFTDLYKRSKLLFEISEKLTNDSIMTVTKILLTDYVHKIADMITMINYLDPDSVKILTHKKFLQSVIKKIEDAELIGYEFNSKKIDIIEQQFERV